MQTVMRLIRNKKVLLTAGIAAVLLTGIVLVFLAGISAPLPDPEVYFGDVCTVADTITTERTIRYFIECDYDFRRGVKDYTRMLVNEYPFEFHDVRTSEDEGDFWYQMRYNGCKLGVDRDHASISVSYSEQEAAAGEGPYRAEIAVFNRNAFDFVWDGVCDPDAVNKDKPIVKVDESHKNTDTKPEVTQEEPKPEPKPEVTPAEGTKPTKETKPKEEVKPKDNLSVLPDPLKYDTAKTFELTGSGNEYLAVYVAHNKPEAAQMGEDYVRLLENKGYSVISTDFKDFNSAGTVQKWYLSNPKVQADSADGTGAQVYVKLNFYKGSGDCEFTVAFGKGITLEGYEHSVEYSGEDDFFAKCPACHGTKKCTHCNGRGTRSKYQHGIGKDEYDCTFCSDGRCPTCYGTGKP